MLFFSPFPLPPTLHLGFVHTILSAAQKQESDGEPSTLGLPHEKNSARFAVLYSTIGHSAEKKERKKKTPLIPA